MPFKFYQDIRLRVRGRCYFAMALALPPNARASLPRGEGGLLCLTC
jgi:hypothetical protein